MASERIQRRIDSLLDEADLQRAVNQGKRLGRPPGSKDRKKRSRRGYFARWAE